jgi:spermidine/putrescine transport system substrate-binding protein
MAGARRVQPYPSDPFARLAALRLSRRRFIGRGAVTAAGLALVPPWLAACGDDDTDTASGGGDTTQSSSDTLRISNWPLYIAEGFVDGFGEASGLSVDYREDFNDNEQWFAKVKDALEAGQDIGADLVVPTDFLAGRLIRLGWLNPLNDENIPNKSNLRSDLLEASIDPERVYTLPYMSGMVGLGYNRRLAGREITGMDDLWDPAFAGRVTLLSDTQDSLGMVMLSLGDDPSEPTTEAVQRAADKVAEEKDKGQIRRFTGNDYIDDLAAGNVVVAMAYSGDVVQLQADDPDLDFIVPETGGTTFVDVMVIPTTTRNQLGAEEWMDYVYDRPNYAQLINYVQFVPVLSDMTDELAKLDPEVAANPLINPSEETLANLYSWPALSDEDDAAYATIYAEVTGE